MGKQSKSRKGVPVSVEVDDDSIDSYIYPLTEACHHYTKLKEVPWDIQKYEKCFHSNPALAILRCTNQLIQSTHINDSLDTGSNDTACSRSTMKAST